MKNYVICILSFCIALEISAGIFIEVLNIEWQYILSLLALLCGGLISYYTPHNKKMQLLFFCCIGLVLLNFMNLILIHNYTQKISFINFGLALMCMGYYLEKHIQIHHQE